MAVRDLLFELGTEELPPRTLLGLSTALTDGMTKGLDAAGVPHGAAKSFATPRRLAVLVPACAEYAPDRRVERRGPPVSAAFGADGAPTQAATAFARSCGVEVAALERLHTDKGAWLAFRGTEPGAATVGLLDGIIQQALAALPIAKRMRWGARGAEFVRPARWLVLLFGDEVVPLELLGLTSGRVTAGHRFHAPRPITLRSPKTYESQLRRGMVIADFAKRRALVRTGVLVAAESAAGATALIEDGLLDEVTALVEWPVPVVGQFEQRFLALPREVVIATVQEHQRYFPVEAGGRLTGGFITVSNLKSRDPAKVRAGNERVVRPRLSDAAFFWDQDRKVSLEAHAARLAGVTFQTKLGSYAEKAARVRQLALVIAERISARNPNWDAGLVARAAELAKADLMTAMVGEFPELQGTMGRYYALAQGEPPELARAIEEHYRPRYAGDALPESKTGQALALADKLDTLVGIFAIDQRPTGTKDPFGLRRAALGLLRILLEGHLDLDLTELLRLAAAAQPVQRPQVDGEVYDFIAERLRGLLLERADGTAEMIDAVLALRPVSPLDVATRLQALKAFLLLPEAAVLTAINKRIVNLLRKAPAGHLAVDATALAEPAERELYRVLEGLTDTVRAAIGARRYADALNALTGLRAAVDDFFEHIMVMDADLRRRANRLALLRDVHLQLAGVADLSRLPG